jgi:Leucine-rich repeat (LRR) protein
MTNAFRGGFTRVFFCLLTTFFSIHSIQSQSLEQDSLALVVLYNSTDGPNWYESDNWLTASPLSSWFGVTVENGRLTRLELDDNNLSGSLPSEIGNWTAIERLGLPSNNLSGPIPAAIGQCASLNTLLLMVNELTTIPSEIAQCSQLEYVSLYRNAFTGPFPTVFLDMTQLITLDLGSNEFSGPIPAGINNLTNLTRLTLERNEFSGIMPNVHGLENIVEFHLNENNLSGKLDEILGDHPNMYYMNWNDNQFTGCYEASHFNKDKLQLLNISANQLDCVGDFSGFVQEGVLERFRCALNQLDFDDLIPLYELDINDFYYDPQSDLGQADTLYLEDGGSATLTFDAGGSGTVYQWYYNGTAHGNASSNGTLSITNFDPLTDQGAYTCEATNAAIPGLVLKRSRLTLFSDELLSTEGEQASVRGLSAFPNPSDHQIRVQLTGFPTAASLRLYNLHGQRVLNTIVVDGAKEAVIQVAHLKAGVYLLQAYDQYGQSDRIRVVIQ